MIDAKDEEHAAGNSESNSALKEDADDVVGEEGEEDDVVDKLNKARSEAVENYDRYLRTAAELDNFRKRAVRMRAESREETLRDLLLQIAPLLPFYDIDPNKVQFVGTGVWDNEVFFYEPSLQNSIFPGISEKKRKNYMNNYYARYKKQPSRTITIPYDLMGIIEHIINNKLNLEDVNKLLNNNLTTFDGIDGQFRFNNNIINRKLDVLKIANGKANLFIKSQ